MRGQRDGFFVFEGINGAGKTTVMQKVAERLREKHGAEKIVTMANPTQGPVGVELRRFIVETKSKGLPHFFSKREETVTFATHLALLFMADRAAMQAEIEAVPEDKTILCDRYSLSTLVYQCAMVGDVHYQSPLASMICRAHETFFRPEVTIVFDLPVQAARFRRSAQGERVDDAMMAEIDPVAASMYRDAVSFKLPSDSEDRWSIFGDVRGIDASRPMNEIVEHAYAICDNRLLF